MAHADWAHITFHEFQKGLELMEHKGLVTVDKLGRIHLPRSTIEMMHEKTRPIYPDLED